MFGSRSYQGLCVAGLLLAPACGLNEEAPGTVTDDQVARLASTESTSYIWPLSDSATPDETNTSFGPRINEKRWDFHDGVDLPAACTTTSVHAVAGGTVVDVGDANSNVGSRHVVVRVDDAVDGPVFVYYLHLDSIDPSVQLNQGVSQHQVIAKVGKDDASYCHLHLEFRKGSRQQVSSVHPLRYLPYTDTANFTAPAAASARFNRKSDGLMAARLRFGAGSKLEGDLLRVEVDLLRSDATLIATRVGDLHDKTTVNEGIGDDLEYRNNIALEGYQSSDMVEDGRTDLQHGILLRSLPADCAALVARVIDLGGHTATSAAIAVPNQSAFARSASFENSATTPDGWTELISAGATSVSYTAGAARVGARGMLSVDSSLAATSQRASIVAALASNRFEWQAEGWFRPDALSLPADQSVYPLYLVDSSGSLSLAARIRNKNGIVAGILAKLPDGDTSGKDSAAVIATGSWRKWTLRLLRVFTRETTAILFLDDVEVVRFNWDSTAYEPRSLRAGIGHSSNGVTATMSSDDIAVTEQTP